jgi:hypothetical protein
MKKTSLLILLLLFLAISIEAQQGQNQTFSRDEVYNVTCRVERGWWKSLHHLIDSVDLIAVRGILVLRVYLIQNENLYFFGNKSAIAFMFYDSQRMSNNVIYYNTVDEVDPQTLNLLKEGFVGAMYTEDNKLNLVVNLGVDNYFTVVLKG